MKTVNEMKLIIDSKSINESYSRVAVGAFVSCVDPNLEELTDIKTAVSEAVTNAIVHGYKDGQGKIYINVSISDNNIIRIKIRDKGIGIENVEKAMQPLFTTAASGDRAGLGFAVMESFMDRVKVNSKPGRGTTVTLEKRIWGKCI